MIFYVCLIVSQEKGLRKAVMMLKSKRIGKKTGRTKILFFLDFFDCHLWQSNTIDSLWFKISSLWHMQISPKKVRSFSRRTKYRYTDTFKICEDQ